MERPSYKIGIAPEKYTTDKNEPFNIYVKVSGGGKILKAKLTGYSDAKVRLEQFQKYNKEEKYEYRFDHIFVSVPVDGFEERPGFEQFPSHALIYEFGQDHIAIIRVKALSVGDHIINFVFSYTHDDIEWYSDRLEFKFHVNTVMDKHGLTFTIVGLIMTFLGFIFRQEVYDFIKRAVNYFIHK